MSSNLQPVNDAQRQPKLFKFKSTISVKEQTKDCDGSFPSNLAPTVGAVLASATRHLRPLTGQLHSPPTSGTTTRVTAAPGNLYIYHLATSNLKDSSATGDRPDPEHRSDDPCADRAEALGQAASNRRRRGAPVVLAFVVLDAVRVHHRARTRSI